MTDAKMPNGVTAAKRVSFESIGCKYRGKPKHLATVDFGTSHCSLAYLLNVDIIDDPANIDPVCVTFLCGPVHKSRVSTSALFDSDGDLVYFGESAIAMYKQFVKSGKEGYHFFHHIKSAFQRDKKIEGKARIKAHNGVEFYLVDVIAHVLNFLKYNLIETMQRADKDLESIDFDWVITVPAIWTSSGKQLMRKAGYQAGLCSVKSPKPLEPAVTQISGITDDVNELNPERLSLALEPESAAIHCLRNAMTKEKKVAPLSSKYIVVDMGGGTGDIACHIITEGFVEERQPAIGGFYGGTMINKQFQMLLEDIFEDPGFSKYLQGPNSDKHKASIHELLYVAFEAKKLHFGKEGYGEDGETYNIALPPTLWKTYTDKMKTPKFVNIDFDHEDHDIILNGKKMAELFHPVIDNLWSDLKSLLSEVRVDTIYWVGGFGGCIFLQRKIEELVTSTFDPERKLRFATPLEPHLAVLRGATAFRCNPGIVRKRKSPATFGVDCRIPFIDGLHEEKYRTQLKDSNTDYCDDIFLPVVSKGDDICTNEAFQVHFSAPSKDSSSAIMTVYSSPKPARTIYYTTDTSLKKIGVVKSDMGGKGLDRTIEIVFEFTHTEIQAVGYDPVSKSQKKVVIDFY